jgi:hypothetical protein
MTTPIEQANAGVQVVKELDMEDVRRRGGIMISDALAIRMYELERMVGNGYTDKVQARQAGRAEAAQELLKHKTRAKIYKRDLRRLNAAHRLLVLEHRALKRSYDDVLRKLADVKKASFDDVPF